MKICSCKRNGFSLLELLITIAVFSILGLLLARLTQSFVDVYLRSRDQADLQKVCSALVEEIASGDDAKFDGLKSAAEILYASDKEISFVPVYREMSQPAGYYTTHGLMNTQTQDGGPPPQSAGVWPGGLRIQYNPKGVYELRYYLPYHPRAGIPNVEVLIRYSESLDGKFKGSTSFSPIPVRFVYNSTTTTQDLIAKPRSYFVFTGGNFPLEFPGTETNPPSQGEINQIMINNQGQLFPNPFERPEDTLLIFFHPETDLSVISAQDHLIAHLFLNQSYADQPTRFDLTAKDTIRLSDPSIQGIHKDSLLLSYDKTLSILPGTTTLINSNLEAQSLRFLSQIPTEQKPYKPSRFSYYSSRDTTKELEMEMIEGRMQIPYTQLNNISLVQMDLLAIIGSNLDNFSFAETSKRQFSHLIPLQTIEYTQSFHTNASAFNSRLGFQSSNCPYGTAIDKKCRQITNNFPSGKKLDSGGVFLFDNLRYHTNSEAPTGIFSVVLRDFGSGKVYIVRYNYNKGIYNVYKKAAYNLEDLPFAGNEEFVLEAQITRKYTINLANLDPDGFIDEDFNWNHKKIWDEFFSGRDQFDLYVELSLDCNIEGFSLTWKPK